MMRVRGPNGMFTFSLSDVGSSSVSELTAMLKDKSGMKDDIEILSSYPPVVLVSSTDLKAGDTLIIRAVASERAALPHPPSSSSEPADATSPSSHKETKRAKHEVIPPMNESQNEDAELARALAASLAESQEPKKQPKPTAASGPPKVAPTAVKMNDGSCLVRRIVDADNSCLFNSIGYLFLDHDKSKASTLRDIVATAIRADPFTYNEGVLEGKSTEEYCKWIQSSNKWGGAVELSILSLHFGMEVAAFDIRTKREDVYSAQKGYKERVYLIYDGLHYDPLALSLFDGAPDEIDVTVFPSPGHASSVEAREEGSRICKAALQLVTEIHNARQYTDVANFTLRCGTCQVGLKGETEAVIHAKTTGHSNFQEY